MTYNQRIPNFKTSSVVSYPNRDNRYGKNSYRGNCTGLLIKDMIEFFKPKLFVDACEGSKTSRDVCKELGISYVGLDLYNGNDFTKDSILTELPYPADVCFTHPPYHCLYPESLVINDIGIPKPIKNFKVGDKTINKDGEIVNIVAVASKKNTKIIKTIEIEGYTLEPLKVTSDHKCLVIEAKKCKYKSQKRLCEKECKHPSNKTGSCIKGDAPYHHYKPIWKRAEDINVGDYMLYAKPKSKISAESIKISDFINMNSYSLDNDYIWFNKNKNGKTKRDKLCQYSIKNTVIINNKFAYLAGLFIAEGSTTLRKDGGTIYFSFHENEKEYIDFVKEEMYNLFSVKCKKIRAIKDSKAIRMEFYSKPLAEFFQNIFGEKAPNKKIPSFLVYSKESIIRNVLKGLFHGDGCYTTYSYSTTSRALIEQIRLLCSMLGFKFTTHYSKRKKEKLQIHKNKNLSNTLVSYYGYLPKGAFLEIYEDSKMQWHDRALRFENYYGLRIKKITDESYEGKVYDIQVSKGESFLTPSGIVHNCMIKYSGEQWNKGKGAVNGDTSRCKSTDEFLAKSQTMLMNQREATANNGVYATLIGDQKVKGVCRSFQADFFRMMPKSELLNVVIKMQHNTMSENTNYSNRNFIPITHEYLILWKKKAQSFYQIGFEVASDAQKIIASTWRSVIRMVMMKFNGAVTLDRIYAEVEKVAGSLLDNNKHHKEKVRRILGKYHTHVSRGVWAL